MRITIDNVKSALGVSQTYDIVNAIRNSAGDTFKNYVPLADATNVAEVGAGITISQTVQNEFINSLVDRISLVVLRKVSLQNPLKKFKKGQLPMGRTIEEIFVDIAKEKQYNAKDAETTVFKRELPDVKTLFHERSRQGYYQQTIQDDSLKTAFVSWGDFDNFLTGIINAIYNGSEVDEYEYMKLIVDNYMAKGHFKVVQTAIAPTGNTETALKGFVKQVRKVATKMTLPMGSREFNSLGVRTVTDKPDLHLLITPDLEADLDVDVLAYAFNMDKASLMGNITTVDGFSTPGLQAVLIDKDFFMVYDTLQKMETIRNPKGLYWNYFYHVWQVLSASRFQNAVAFVDNTYNATAPVSEIVVSPTISTLSAGETELFKANVRTIDGMDISSLPSLVWSVTANTGTVASGTAIDSNGELTIGATQTTAELLVTASMTFTDADPETPDIVITGKSIVKVQ